MSTYIDTLDQDKVEHALEQIRQGGAPDLLNYAGGDERFALWLHLVDKRIRRLTMGEVSLLDLADWNSRDSYDNGATPTDALENIAEYDDLFEAFLSEQEA